MSDEIQVEVPGHTAVLRFTDTVRLGRSDENVIVVDDQYVSGEHIELRRTDDGWAIIDVGSTNGTFVNGARVTQKPLGHLTRVRLGHPQGPELVIKIPGLASAPKTMIMPSADIVDRYLGEEAPEEMSERTRVLRTTIHQHRQEETRTWLKRMRRLHVALVALVVVSLGVGGFAIVQAKRVSAQRAAAADLFYTLKSLELDIRRLEAAAGPDASVQQRQARLADQYQDLLTTLGIYSESTPEEVQLIYRTVHRLGESEATVPQGFVDEVLRYVEQWKAVDLQASLDRAAEGDLGTRVANTLLEYNLPREFFYLALQESKLDPRAIGPTTRFGVAKGMWQFIPSTAEAYGLQIGPLQGERQFDPLDERHDVEKATAAAARYLADIYTTDAQASGLLVMAAYNWGEPRVLRLIRSMPESPAERNFWSLLEQHRERIPEETYGYVFRIVSAAVIGANPELFGFDFDPPLNQVPGSVADALE
ncbi:MAG: transglycosylase SLT domain-containing protein [Longimicrobiales bacterium]